MKYDLSLLTDIEFQKLINELIEKKYSGKIVEQFSEGPDGGMDGRIQMSPTEVKIIQSKHYLKTGYSGLKKQIKKKEFDKIKRLKPVEYVLATSIDLSAKQVDELKEIILAAIPTAIVEIWGYQVIESELDQYPEVVKSTIKLWAQNVEIVKHILNPEAESSFLCLQRRWKKIDKFFVPFEKINDFTKILNDQHVVIISGEPGIGKTTLAEHICKNFYIDGFRVVIIEDERFNHQIDLTNPEDKILYYFDDFLGSNYFAGFKDSFDRKLVNVLREVKNQKNKRFILTSRTNIIEKGIYLSDSFEEYHLKDISIPIMSIDLNREIKAKILYNHIWHSSLNEEVVKDIISSKLYRSIIEHENFNPRLIEFITDQKNYEIANIDYGEFVKKSLDNPQKIWERCYSSQLNEFQRILIKLVVANGGIIEEEALRKAYYEYLEGNRISVSNNERTDYSYVIKICENSLLKRCLDKGFSFDFDEVPDEYRISTFNPSVNDFVIPLIKNSYELKKLFNCLNSLECIRFICSSKFDKKEELLISILNAIKENNKIRIYALNELVKINMKVAENYVKELLIDTSVSFNDAEFVILNVISKVDCSDFIERNIETYCADYSEYYELYEKYFKSSFYREYIGKIIYDKFYSTLEDGFEDLLHDNEEFNGCFNEKEGYDCLDGILNEFHYLKEDDRKKLFGSIDMSKEIENNIEQQWMDDYEYYEKIKNEPSFDLDSFFCRLLER